MKNSPHWWLSLLLLLSSFLCKKSKSLYNIWFSRSGSTLMTKSVTPVITRLRCEVILCGYLDLLCDYDIPKDLMTSLIHLCPSICCCCLLCYVLLIFCPQGMRRNVFASGLSSDSMGKCQWDFGGNTFWHLWDGLPWNLVHTFVSPSKWIVITLTWKGTGWHFLKMTKVFVSSPVVWFMTKQLQKQLHQPGLCLWLENVSMLTYDVHANIL